MRELVIDIATSGAAKGMHFDEFPLTYLGKATISRASEIVWDDMSQTWSILLPGQQKAFTAAAGFAGYEEARGFEVRWLQECRRLQVEPFSPEGKYVAGMIRVS